MSTIWVKVPATTANLGPGFDALGLALDLWNEAEFSLPKGGGAGWTVEVSGEGAGILPTDASNLVAWAAQRVFKRVGQEAPARLRIHCTNRIPLGSGLGSSAAAVAAGLVGANALLNSPFSTLDLLRMAAEIEGHPDNAAAAFLGGLTVVITGGNASGGDLVVRKIEIPPLTAVVVAPEFSLSTHTARAALPGAVALSDAVFNLGRTALVVEALRTGDLELLGYAMQDRLHQPYRLELIPGAEAALAAARQAGAAAVALSGAGPGVVAFGKERLGAVRQAMQDAFRSAGLSARAFILTVTSLGTQLIIR